MNRIVIFGNSGSGKSHLARQKAAAEGLAHLDLDTVAWAEGSDVPARRPLAESRSRIEAFLDGNPGWVVEGCYSSLLETVFPRAMEIIFLNPGVDTCLANSRNRPWEPHKYESPEAQDANLAMLTEWIAEYETRDDEFSLSAHRQLYDDFRGTRTEYRSNARPE